MRRHSWLTPKCSIGQSSLEALGVIAHAPIDAGELIAIWGGVILTSEEVDAMAVEHPEYATSAVSVWEGFYLASLFPKDEVDDSERFNHSCDANAGVVGQIVLLARRAIAIGEEVTFDYDTTETSPQGGFECQCVSTHCRGVINGSAWKDPSFRERYEGFLSVNVLHAITRTGTSN